MNSSVLVLIYNKDGDLTLQLRSVKDDAYPLHWDFSAGGGIEEGETVEMAAKREVQEELGISISLTEIDMFHYKDVRALDPSYVYANAKDDDAMTIFRGEYDGVFSPNPHEVQAVRLVDSSTLKVMIAAKEKFHPELYYFLTQRMLLE